MDDGLIECLEQTYGEQEYKILIREAAFQRQVPGIVTSRTRSFAQQWELVSDGKSKVFPSQHNFGLAFDYVPRRSTLPAIRTAARKAGLILIEEKTHLHLQAIPAPFWRRYVVLINNWCRGYPT